MSVRHEYTLEELEWAPWLEPVDLGRITHEQRQALRITPSNMGLSAYSLTLAHDPESLEHRSPLYNAIMFGAGGLARADRELGALATSRINGCVYCASVHARRFIMLAKAPDVVHHIYAEGVETRLDPHRRAVVDYAAKLTRDPASVGPDDLLPLREAGLSDLEILDLTNAVAMFAWANRLMLTLGEPVMP